MNGLSRMSFIEERFYQRFTEMKRERDSYRELLSVALGMLAEYQKKQATYWRTL